MALQPVAVLSSGVAFFLFDSQELKKKKKKTGLCSHIWDEGMA